MGECKVCYEPFDGESHSPRFLPCGHTFCTKCLVSVQAFGPLICPMDKRDFSSLVALTCRRTLISNGYVMNWLWHATGR
jgi:hypothetical protein